MSVRIRKFDPTTMKPSRIVYLIGKRHSGKSCLMKDILYHMPRPDYVLAMAPTQSTLESFREYLPESCIFEGYSQEKLEQTIATQKELISRGKKRNVLLILDDCLYSSGVLKSVAQRYVHFNGRHSHIGMICAAQYMMSLPPEMRTNIDYLFVMRDPVLINRQKLWKNFFGTIPTMQLMESIMSTVTQNYGALVLDGTVPSTDYTDSVMWYRARTDVPDFKLCKPIFWKLSKKYGLTDEDKRRAQERQFKIETAEAKEEHSKGKKVLVVETEDENGHVVSV